LSSATVLREVLNQHIQLRSSVLAEDAEETLQIYVENASLRRAHELLEKEHVCVIAGLPGIGKTTLAQVLITQHAAEDYDVVVVSQDIDEALRVWSPEASQIFYYDDFLGQTSLDDKLGKNEDARLMTFLRRVHSAPNKRCVLTTREYILQQAKSRYEKLARHNFDVLTTVIDIEDYTALVRAKILYNHVYFSHLHSSAKRAFAAPQRYEAILDHRNYNPRLVRLSILKMRSALGCKVRVPSYTCLRRWITRRSSGSTSYFINYPMATGAFLKC